MKPTVVVQELVIVIAAKNLNPTILNPDLLKYSGIVPADWELQGQPLLTNRGSQVIFANGISIVVEPTRVMFMEAIDGKAAASVELPGIARKYVQTLPNAEYRAMGLNPRGYATFNNQDSAHKYLSQTLLSPGAWQEVGSVPVRVTVNYTYTLERSQFNLSVNDAALRQSNETTTPIVLFSGNFNYNIAGNTGSEKLMSLYQAIDNWEADLEIYKEIVNTKFLAFEAETKALLPDVFAMSARASA